MQIDEEESETANQDTRRAEIVPGLAAATNVYVSYKTWEIYALHVAHSTSSAGI